MHISLEQANKILREGSVVAVPTETVYGLAASMSIPEAVQKIFLMKGRPSNNPLIVHLSDAVELRAYVDHLPDQVEGLVEAFWPGPLTLVLEVKPEKVPSVVRAGLPTAALRVPEHPLARALLKLTGPLVMPSANLSGKPSATCREHVETDFGIHFPVLDGGPCLDGLESTILIFREHRWQIIRLGAIPAEDFVPVLGYCPQAAAIEGAQPICPGQLYRHYAPKATLHLSKTIPPSYQGVVIGFSDRCYPDGARLMQLGAAANPELAANNLYSVLRRLDQEGISMAYVDINFPQNGLWATIMERLNKAAQK